MNEEAFTKLFREELNKLPGLKKSSMYIYDQVMGFYYAVSWSKEPWLQALLVFHLITFLLVIFKRGNFPLQVSIFLTLSSVVFLAEHLNQMAADRWRDFSTQNYFDKHGVFVSVILSAPMLLILFLQLLLMLKDASHMVVKVKRHELGIEKANGQKKKEQ